MQIKKAGIITIGNEILLGKTLNTNLAWIGDQLAQLGISLEEAITIKDDKKAIMDCLESYTRRYDLIITTGGLGPTKDDISKNTIAEFFGKELIFIEEIWQKIQDMFAFRNVAIPEVNRNQAIVPQDFIALDNQQGTAPGLFYEFDNKLLFCFPGVPLEMKHLFTDRALAIIKEKYQVSSFFLNTINTYGISESATAEILDDIILEENVNLAWLPQTGRVDLRIYGHNSEACQKLNDEIKKRLKDYLWAENSNSLSETIHNAFIKNNKSISLAESCTGGLIQKLLTDNAGSSVYLKGGIVCYSNESKKNLLGVSQNTLDEFGAVSHQTAKEMLIGLKKNFKSDYYVSVTGIAGPDGGTEEKPVGLVYIGIADHESVNIFKMRFLGTRDSIRFKTAEFVFYKILKLMENR